MQEDVYRLYAILCKALEHLWILELAMRLLEPISHRHSGMTVYSNNQFFRMKMDIMDIIDIK